MSFGFGFGFTKITAAIRAAFSPSSLFAANEPGVWYDPSDFSTMFQDAAGTTPVTAVEQPVGLMLDKSKGLVLGPELVVNGDFSNGTTGWALGTAWKIDDGALVLSNSTIYRQNAANVGTVTIGKTYLVKIDVTSTTYAATTCVIGGVAYSIFTSGKQSFIATALNNSIFFRYIEDASGVRSATIKSISVRELPGNHAYQTTATSRPVLSARVNQYLATETLATQNVTTLAAYYHLRFEGTGTITLSGTATGVYSAGLHLIPCTAGTLTSTVSGSVTKADLRVANVGVNLPPYQRVNTATDYDTAGFPHYLRFDGVDDFLVTPTITPGTDKVQVFAGVRKLRVAPEIIAETGASSASPGAFFLVAETASNRYGYAGRGYRAGGTDDQVDLNFFPPPDTAVLTVTQDINGNTRARMRRNAGAWSNSINTTFGGGDFLAYPLYIGRRAGTTFPFNGHLYSLIVRFGSNLPIETIEQIEKYVNTKTRAY